ncbi:hypothetical protein FHX15_005894 [Rhizobium sp. BK650]|nr:hypothetical protein [Rhizobium sp. BK650]
MQPLPALASKVGLVTHAQGEVDHHIDLTKQGIVQSRISTAVWSAAGFFNMSV